MLYQESGYLTTKLSRQQICYQELTEAFERLGYDFDSAKRSSSSRSQTLSSKDCHSKAGVKNISEQVVYS